MARRRHAWSVLAATAAIGLLALGGYGIAETLLAAPVPDNGRVQVFEIRPHEGLGQISGDLARADLVRSAPAFRILAVASGHPIQPGLYDLSSGMNARAILKTLLAPVQTIRLTLPEGYSIRQIARLVSKLGLATEPEVEAAARSPGPFRGRFPWLSVLPDGASLEGFLFPDTYYVPSRGLAPRQLIAMMLARFGQVAWPLIEDRSHPLKPFGIVTLASIVEREAKVSTERPIIAGVFLSRLRLGMPLGSDPTVEYALGRREDPSHPLTLDDVRIDSPYNTYRFRGLPPGPIANPGLASLEAAIHPAQTPYLYFVARGDGTHQFSRTYHQQLVAQRHFQR